MGSHDFINFPPRLGNLSPKMWMLMGEIQARIEQLATLPIPPAASEELRLIYLSQGVQATVAIEGSSLSDVEVRDIIEKDKTLPPSRKYLQTEVENILAALNDVGRDALRGGDADFSLDLLNRWHGMVLAGLDEVLRDGVAVGALRSQNVVVGRYVGAPPAECERLVNEFCAWLNEERAAPDGHEQHELAWQVVRAMVAHVYLALIHPYGDGNGRLSRLVEFAIMLRAGVPDIAAHLLSNFYNATRARYYRELQNTHGDMIDGAYPPYIQWQGFLEYALQGCRDSLAEQFNAIQDQLAHVIWHDHVHRAFPKQMTIQQQRRKQLALSMIDLEREHIVSAATVRELTPALAAAYAGRNSRTIIRDLDELVNMALVKKAGGGYQSNSDILFAFFANVRPPSH